MSASAATFVGVDLAWRSGRNPSGAVVLREQEDGAALVDVAPPVRSIEAVLAYVREHAAQPCVVAIDAPLIIPNESGQRHCERLVGRRYGARDASCHTSNRTRYPDASSVRLAQTLASEGYVHAPQLATGPMRVQGAPAVMLEVYPHAAMVALFDLPRVVKYKKGTAAERRTGLAQLQELSMRLTTHDPPLVANDFLRRLLERPVGALCGQARKDYEDSLDALFCAYIAFHYRWWGGERTEIFGDVDVGYIATPRLPTASRTTLDGGS